MNNSNNNSLIYYPELDPTLTKAPTISSEITPNKQKPLLPKKIDDNPLFAQFRPMDISRQNSQQS